MILCLLSLKETNMKKKMFIGMAAWLSLAVVLGGCGGASSSQTAAGSTAEQTEETAAAEAFAEVDNSETSEKTAEAETAREGIMKIPALSLNGGGFMKMPELKAPRELNEEENAEMDRAVRAFDPYGQESLMRNQAKEFYYYSKLNAEQRNIYEALLMLTERPDNPEGVVVVRTALSLENGDFLDACAVGLYAMLYDHPERFWLYNAICTDVRMAVPQQQTLTGGTSEVYLYFDRPYTTYEQDLTAFNQAADDFLAGIDLNNSQEGIARQIHDKLVDLVTYDDEVAEKGLTADFAHTAYGVLVENSRGQANTAVCDGYSLAYEYLLQQAGIPAAVIIGNAGGSPSDAGCHAWNIIMIDGKWREVDSTWDDAGTLEDQIRTAFAGTDNYVYYEEAVRDVQYRDMLQHYLYCVSTAAIRSFDPGDNYYYISRDGRYQYTLLGPSVHIRLSELDQDALAELISLAPLAE